MRRRELIRCLILLTLLLVTPDWSEASRTWSVFLDGSGDAPTIQAAIDSAQSGDVVLVGPGSYEEGWTEIHSKSLTLRSASGAKVTSIQHLSIFERPPGAIQSVEVSGFSFVPGLDEAAFYVLNVQSFGMLDCVIRGYRDNSEINKVHDIAITRCDFIENQDSHSDMSFAGTLYIEIPADSHGSILRRCKFIGNSSVNGIPAVGYGGGAVRVVTADRSDFRITECLFLDNSARSGGAASLENDYITFDHNAVIANEAEDGAVFRSGRHGEVYGNAFVGNKTNGLHDEAWDRCLCNAYWNNEGWGPYHGQWVGTCSGGENLYVDPLFCDPEADDYRLRENSPLIPKFFPPEVFDCQGVMGALRVGCEPQATLTVTWGRLKSLYKP
jgi:hypothetical protein